MGEQDTAAVEGSPLDDEACEESGRKAHTVKRPRQDREGEDGGREPTGHALQSSFDRRSGGIGPP